MNSKKKILNFSIKHSSPIPLSLLFNELANKQFRERSFATDSNIYFICKVKKVRYDLSNTFVQDGKLKVTLLFDNKTFNLECDFFEGKKIRLLPASTNKFLVIDIEDYENSPLYLTPDLTLQHLKVNIGNRPELIYIGYSKDPIKRLVRHEKIVKAIVEIEDDYELRFYVNEFQFHLSIREDKNVGFATNLAANPNSAIRKNFKDYNLLAERVLINFFQTEGLNDNHIGIKMNTDKLFKKLLLKNEISFLGGGIAMETKGEYFDFFSKKMQGDEKEFFLDYRNLDNKYQPLSGISKSFYQK